MDRDIWKIKLRWQQVTTIIKLIFVFLWLLGELGLLWDFDGKTVLGVKFPFPYYL